MNTVHERLRHLRKHVKSLSLREFRAQINAELAGDEKLSLGTISNYERPVKEGRRATPRADFLAALKRAFPEVRLEWLILGKGQPTEVAESLASPEGIEARAQETDASTREGSRFAAQVLERYPDLELLSPEASALFMAGLTRIAMGEPDMAIDKEQLLELAGDLRWLVLCPLGVWGFKHAPPYRDFADYAVSMLHALMQLMPNAGEGDQASEYRSSRGPQLRRIQPVGF